MRTYMEGNGLSGLSGEFLEESGEKECNIEATCEGREG